MRISHNLMAMNADRMLGITKSKSKESVQKLSSGYKINRAADDAAGLAISEKMRYMIRGLNQGTENAEHGVSWVQIGDGALNEAQELLHRMTELSVKSLNGTNSDSDRMAMELEFEALQCELDRISASTEFNEMPIFEQHEIPYYQCEGAVEWDPQQMHVVTAGDNDLTFKYRATKDGPEKAISVTVPAGEYTTQELVDEIDSALREVNNGKPLLVFEFTSDGFCNANVEGGEIMESVSGGLSYLMYDMYKGGSYGALLGTTEFVYDTDRLKIVSDKNDFMTFQEEVFADGSVQNRSIKIQPGAYTRTELIDIINTQLEGAGSTVRASAYGTGIKLASDDAMVNGFKGNMFKIDGTKPIYNSVFYDNIHYGSATQTAAAFTGGYVLTDNANDKEHNVFRIDNTNNTLTLQPNQAQNPVTVQINPGEYSIGQMVSELNTQLNAHGVTATSIKSGNFYGIRLTSTLKGQESTIGLDVANSSAYETLFVKRNYVDYTRSASPVNETKDDSEAYLQGSKSLASPLTITQGVNDQFKLSLTMDGATTPTEYTITLAQGTYADNEAIRAQIDTQLNGAAAGAGYKGKLSVELAGNKIKLTGTNGSQVSKISVAAVTGNGGLDAIFQGYNAHTSTPVASGTGSVTLNTTFTGEITDANKNMSITVGSSSAGNQKTYNVTLPTGTNVSQTDVKNAIETAIPGKTELNKFNTVTENATTTGNTVSMSDYGSADFSSLTLDKTGSSTTIEGSTAIGNNVAAKVTFAEVPGVRDTVVINNTNNSLTLTINDEVRTLTLTAGSYNKEALKNHLQSLINTNFASCTQSDGFGSATVSLENNQLVITANLPQGRDGLDTNVKCNTGTSTFLRELRTTRTAASASSNRAVNNSVTIGADNKFVFTYKDSTLSTNKTVTLTLDQGTYTREGIKDEINKQLKNGNYGVEASLENDGRLTLRTAEKNGGTYVSYATNSIGNTSAEALFGPLKVANALIDRNTLSSITIEPGISNTFSMEIDGQNVSVTLDATNSPYTREQFVNMLNGKLSGAGVAVKAYTSGSKIGFKTTDSSISTIKLDYDNGGNCMKAVYGETTYPGVEVSFNNGKMTLTTASGTPISVPVNGSFQQEQVKYTPITMSTAPAYHSGTSYIDGYNFTGNVTINQWNKDLQFKYEDNGTNVDVNITLDEGIYSQNGAADGLEKELQDKIDAAVGSGKITVTVDGNGVRLETVNTGSKYGFSGFDGGFYDLVICRNSEVTNMRSTQNVDGQQLVTPAYAVGRKDILSEKVDIREGISDELSLDLAFGGNSYTFDLDLDGGEYSGSELVAHVQEKLNEALAAQNLPEGMIEVGIGGINTNVVGSNDNSAINFKISKNVNLPTGGDYVIDGVRGSAAFEIFYRTDGKNEPAYITGSKDVTQGITIKPDATELTVVADGQPYTIDLPEGYHTADSIMQAMNDAFNALPAPVQTEIVDGKLRICYEKLGIHAVSEVYGSAKNSVFFNENGETEELARHVRLSSVANDTIGLKRQVFNTASIGLNSCCISKPKYAAKALERLEIALERISNIRSDFGSTQNRLEHAINNNENKAENLQAAESRIRDTDMAEEMMKLSTFNILQQAGEAMLTQANQSYQGVLKLLQ